MDNASGFYPLDAVRFRRGGRKKYEVRELQMNFSFADICLAVIAVALVVALFCGFPAF